MGSKEKKLKSGEVLSDNAMRKKYRGSGLASDISVMPEDSLWLPSRSLHLNYTMGGGIPYGKNCEIFGGESSGKSLVAMDFGYVAQYLGGIILWNDAEQSFDPGWFQKNGLSLDKIVLYNETAVERVSDWAADMAMTWRNKLKNNEPILLVVDSLAALDCEVNINSTQTDAKAEMGNRAKAIYRFLRTRNQMFSELGIIGIFINQLRQKVGASMFEDPDTTPGGNAMKFYAHQRMAFFRKKQITTGKGENKIWLGNEVSVRMKKNKVAPPRSSFTSEIYFNAEYGKVGFNKYQGLAEILEDMNIVERAKGGSRYTYKGEVIANGHDNFQELLENDAEIRSKLIKESGINTVMKTKKQLDKLREQGTNRYSAHV